MNDPDSRNSRLRELEIQIGELRAAVSKLQREVDDLRCRPGAGLVESMLRQRGFPLVSHGPRSQLLLALEAPAEVQSRFYTLMKRYSFRLFLRDLIRVREVSGARELLKYSSEKTARAYLRELSILGVIEELPQGGFRLLNGVPSFGPTLEWFVSQVFEREFLAPALFNVQLRQTAPGGDYDIIAAPAGRLTCVEVKSSPPRGVEIPSVAAFLERITELRPEIAIFLVDTELRMKDKIVPLFEKALELRGLDSDTWKVERLHSELFHIRHSIYLINSRKGIYTNLRHCIRDSIHSDGPMPHRPPPPGQDETK